VRCSVAVCYRVLQYAVCCSTRKLCVAVCCNVLQCTRAHDLLTRALHHNLTCVLQCVFVCCSIQRCCTYVCVVVCCSIHTHTISSHVRYATTLPVRCSMLQCAAMYCSVPQCSAVIVVLQCVAVFLQHVAVYTHTQPPHTCAAPRLYLCAAVCCSVL